MKEAEAFQLSLVDSSLKCNKFDAIGFRPSGARCL